MLRRLIAIAISLHGCAVDPTGTREQPIVGGTTDSADTSVVLVYAQVPGSSSASLCTGSVVSPHVILTAAHCVLPSVVGVGAKFTVFTGTTLGQTGTQLAVQATHADSSFDLNNLQGGHDFGVVILSQPTTLSPIQMNRTALTAAQDGASVRLIGYGATSGALGGVGTRRQTSTTLTQFDSVLLYFSDGQHETCEGDSGGPALMKIDGVEKLIGATSFGDPSCAQGGYDARLDTSLSFVDPYILQYDPVSEPQDAAPTQVADGSQTTDAGADMARLSTSDAGLSPQGATQGAGGCDGQIHGQISFVGPLLLVFACSLRPRRRRRIP